ncbi:MAG: DUF86 domain-containing protein [Desulfobacteraceae bacterium]|nr:DUF86 domain-containing protein [Desulfobacteraceae bacterium]
MTINGIIERKLRLLEQKLSEINDWQITSYAEFRQSSLKINAVERALTVCVEIMIDISERILALKKIPPKDTSVENFKELERLKIIQSFETYADMIRFRNFIVHRYETIDTQILFAIVTKKMQNFRSFADEIRNTAAQGI